MGLATIDPHNLVPRVSHLDPGNEVVIHIVGKSTPRFTRFPSLVLIRLVNQTSFSLRNSVYTAMECLNKRIYLSIYLRYSDLKRQNYNKEMYELGSIRTLCRLRAFGWPYISL